MSFETSYAGGNSVAISCASDSLHRRQGDSQTSIAVPEHDYPISRHHAVIGFNIPRSFVDPILWCRFTPRMIGEAIRRKFPFAVRIRILIKFAADRSIFMQNVRRAVVTEQRVCPLSNQLLPRGDRSERPMALLNTVPHRLSILSVGVFVINGVKHGIVVGSGLTLTPDDEHHGAEEARSCDVTTKIGWHRSDEQIQLPKCGYGSEIIKDSDFIEDRERAPEETTVATQHIIEKRCSVSPQHGDTLRRS